MKGISVSRFIVFGAMGGIAYTRMQYDNKIVPVNKSSDMMGDKSIASSLEAYIDLAKECVEFDFVASLATVKRLIHLLEKPNPTYTSLQPLQLELQERLVDESSPRVFISLSLRESDFYTTPLKGWEEIVERFPNTLTDVEEASKCFALARYPGAIFHSLQVVEAGLIELGKLIGVTDPLSGWSATTNRLQSIIKKGHEARTTFEREHFAFLEQMLATIEGLKNAWRNKVSHAQAKLILLTSDFSPDVAEEILYATRAFMRRLATEAPIVSGE